MLGISQEVLGELSGVPASSIANYEARAHRPRPESAERLAAVLNLTVDQLFPPEEVAFNRRAAAKGTAPETSGTSTIEAMAALDAKISPANARAEG
jgi:transcriptional regulator with XRE-family HTH domain